MSYEGLLGQLADEKLNLFQGLSGTPNIETVSRPAIDVISVEEGTVEEEQAATIQTVTVLRAQSASSSPHTNAPTISAGARPEPSTPQRKISTSTRFMNAFQQFYSGATTTSCATSADNDEIEASNANATTSAASAVAAAGRTPTKGMESKLLSMWHNVKYGWSGKLKSNFSKEQPVWLLGRCYHRKFTPPSSMEASTDLTTATAATTATTPSTEYAINAQEGDQQGVAINSATGVYPSLDPLQIDEIVVPQELGMDAAENQTAENPWEEGIEGFRRDFYSRLWMTYRREFPTMNGTNYTSDCGWGCMLRTGQMLLAQGLICHFLGRSWRYDSDTQLHSTYEDSMHRKIIKWFGDSSSKSSPFSIHALVNLGEELGKKPGDWYGPASVSFLLKQALKKASQENADFDNISIYVAKDCTVYIQDIEDECCIPEPPQKPQVPWQTARKVEPTKIEKWKSLIIFIPLRLGTEKLNPVYAHCLKLLLSTEYCIGIIGGRPKHSLYFVGFQEDRLIHLDPHYCQEMVDVNQENFPLQSFHCKSPRKLKAAKMDPSCCIGFYCQTKADFNNFMESVQLYLHPMRCGAGAVDKVGPPTQQMPVESLSCGEINYPLFTFSRGRCQDNERNEMSDSFYRPAPTYQLNDLRLDSEYQNINSAGIHLIDDDDCETEEFVLL